MSILDEHISSLEKQTKQSDQMMLVSVCLYRDSGVLTINHFHEDVPELMKEHLAIGGLDLAKSFFLSRIKHVPKE